MSSAGQAVGGLVGGVIGFFVGGPAGAFRGAQIGMMVGGAIDPPKGPTINGPRLEDLSVQTSTYGAFIPRNYGTVAQAGNVFWMQGDALIEVQTSTTSGGKGGPETTTNTWSYYATFAVGLCKGPIDGVRRIWIGGQLWYDAGSDDRATIIASNEKSNLFTLYLGTDTQTADPLMQADKGAANVPAYRGLAYIVFDTLPLEKYGNSLMGAQVKVEVVKVGAVSSPRLLDLVTVSNWPHPNLGIKILDEENGVLSVYSYPVSASPVLLDGEYYPDVEFIEKLSAAGDTLDSTAVPSTTQRPNTFSNGMQSIAIGTLGGNDVWWCEYSHDLTIGNGVKHVIPFGNLGASRGTLFAQGTVGDIADYLPGETGRYIIGMAISTSCDRILVTTGASSRGTIGIADRYFLLDESLAVVKSGSINVTTAYIWNIEQNSQFIPSGGTVISDDGMSGWTVSSTGIDRVDVRYFTIDATDTLILAAAITTAVTGDHRIGTYLSSGVLYVINCTGSVCQLLTYTAAPTISSSLAILGDIVEAECLTSGLLESADIDVTELTDEVRGYRVSQLGAIRAALDLLRAAWPFDVVQHGYQILFKRRGSASVATIPSTMLDARASGEAPGVQITDSREMDLMLPRRVDIQYLDSVREYDINEQMSPERTSTDAVGIRKLDLPIVFTGAEAAQTAETLLYLYWLERYDGVLRLPPEYSELEPGDVITVTSDTADYELRLTGINTLPDGRMECAAKYNKAAIYTPVARGEEGQSTGGTLTLEGPAVYSLLDIPLLRDDDDTAGFPVAMSGYLSGWPGGILYRSDDGGQSWADLRAFAPGVVIGYATTTLAAHGGTVIDFASTLTVRLYSGTLASVTQAQMFAGQNWFAYGSDGRWEIIAAATAVLQGDGTYILTDFLRGQRGTEWATGLHAANDRIVLLDANSLAFISVNSSTIGTARDYRGITTGRALSSDTSLSFSYDGVNLECLSPVHMTGNRHPSTNDWTLTWTRRSRYDQWRDYVDAPLGETSESYEIDVYSSGTYATVVRTITASSATAAYTSAQQVTDFGSNQATLYLKVYQLSATVGRGYPLTQSITR